MEKNLAYQTYEYLCNTVHGSIPSQIDIKLLEKSRQVVHETIVDLLASKQTKEAITMAWEIKLFDSFMYPLVTKEMQKDAVKI